MGLKGFLKSFFSTRRKRRTRSKYLKKKRYTVRRKIMRGG